MQRALLYLGAFGLLASASTIPLQRRDEGCGKAHGGGYNNNPANHKLDSGRTYTMWVPEDYDPNQQYPLIVDYHGRYGDGSKYRLLQFIRHDYRIAEIQLTFALAQTSSMTTRNTTRTLEEKSTW